MQAWNLMIQSVPQGVAALVLQQGNLDLVTNPNQSENYSEIHLIA